MKISIEIISRKNPSQFITVEIEENDTLLAINQRVSIQLEIQRTTSLFESRKNVEEKLHRILTSHKLNPGNKSFNDVMGMPIPEDVLRNCLIPGNTQKEKSENLQALASLGSHAILYHKKLLALVNLFSSTPEDELLYADQIQRVLAEAPQILDNLARNKLRFFQKVCATVEPQILSTANRGASMLNSRRLFSKLLIQSREILLTGDVSHTRKNHV